LAYSSSLGRLFYTAADGNLEASRIYSINLEGADRRVRRIEIFFYISINK